MSDASDKPTLSIGAVSQATGIPRETLRTWERRYGYPDPERNEAGHRVYRLATVARLRTIKEALDVGHRPGEVIGLSRDELRDLLGSTRRSSPLPTRPRPEEDDAGPAEAAAWRERWIAAAADFDGDALESFYWQEWNRLGGLGFVRDRVGPFLQDLGEAWADGRLNVSHEHFTSETLRDFMTRQWRPLNDRAAGPRFVLASLPGELHCLALHMAATAIVISGCRVAFLGADTPLDDIIATADHQDSRAVIISISRAYDSSTAREMLDALRQAMDRDVLLVVGGGGRPMIGENELQLDDWDQLYDWSRQLAKLEASS